MLEDRIKQYTEAHAYNEEARGKLGQILADLSISGYGRFEFYRPEEGWGVEVCWHTPKNVVFSANNLRVHICTEDCDRTCDVTWDRMPLTANELTSAIVQLFIERTKELDKRTEVINAAVAMFGSPKGPIGDLKRAVKEFEEKKYRIYTMMAGRRITCGPHLFKTPDDAARYAKENDFAADLGLHEYLAVQDETTEKIVKYL